MPEVPPLALATWRLGATAAILLPWSWRRLSRISGRSALAIGSAGTLLAVHFVAWFAAVHLTSVWHAAVLVSLVPLASGAIEAAQGRPPKAAFWCAAGIAALSAGGLAGSGAADASLTGDALAVVAAVAYAGVLSIGERVRQDLDVVAWTAALTTPAALVCGAAAVATATSFTGFSTSAWFGIAWCVLGPQLLGHQSLSWALRWWPASRVSLVLLLEPVGAALLASVAFGARPSPASIVAGALTLAAVAVAANANRPTG